ncbi:holo-ACP synthase [Undibacter mobilis]|uniref:Holo-[acyl-carrier-protein] synthase n=1 Tax=Undibacter mobilis TaxID=2292256 RepID=A0A371B1C6_9BRAD|nr:holo-ACP synthase [Undibacter mobilis]RDV01385.1 holo-ACP synthase [Undibacter mobilis]
MIVGLGSDLCDARRIAKTIERHGERFLSRIFTPIERAKADRRKNRVETYAKRFAAKEACAKALGTGMSHGVFWRDMGVVNLPGGRPTMRLTGGALRQLHTLLPGGHEARIELSMTDEGPLAQAIVIIHAIPVVNSTDSR